MFFCYFIYYYLVLHRNLNTTDTFGGFSSTSPSTTRTHRYGCVLTSAPFRSSHAPVHEDDTMVSVSVNSHCCSFADFSDCRCWVVPIRTLNLSDIMAFSEEELPLYRTPSFLRMALAHAPRHLVFLPSGPRSDAHLSCLLFTPLLCLVPAQSI